MNILNLKSDQLLLIAFFPFFISIENWNLYGINATVGSYSKALPFSIFLMSVLIAFRAARGLIKFEYINSQLEFSHLLTALFLVFLFPTKSTLILLFSIILINFSINSIKIPRAQSLRTLLLVILIPGLIASYKFIENAESLPGEVIPHFYTIYNFEQYYALSALLILGLLFRYYKKHKIEGCFSWLCCVYLSVGSENKTALIVSLYLLFTFFLYSILKNDFFRRLNLIFILICSFFALIFPVISYIIVLITPDLINSSHEYGLIARFNIIYQLLNSLQINELITAASKSQWFIEFAHQPHNQLLSWLVNGGIFLCVGATFMYVDYVKKIIYTDAAVLIAPILIYSVMTEVMEHPFVIIQICLIVGAYLKDHMTPPSNV
jgi:hypothetical protein